MEILSLYFWIGRKIRDLRQTAEMTQDEMSKQLGIARTTLVHWEEGKNRVQIEDLYRLADFFACDVSEFLPPKNKRMLQTKEEAFLEFLTREE